MEIVTFKAFRASAEPESCAEFLREHRRVLEDFGITNVTTNNDSWIHDPDTYVVTARSSVHGLIGGIRLEVARADRELPIRAALYKLDHRIDTVLDDLLQYGNGEICGLWNAHRYASRGLPIMLAHAAVSLANQIGVDRLVCLVAHYTLRHAIKSGFEIIEEIGEGGTFTYPIPSIKAIAMVIPDTITLRSAPIECRQHLLSLRLRPMQENIEMINGEPVLLRYDLCIDTQILDMPLYRSIATLREHHAITA